VPKRPVNWSRILALGLHDPLRPWFIDIGANVGDALVPNIEAGYFQRGLAAEPDAGNFAQLNAAIAARGLGDRIVTDCCGLADRDGEWPLKRAERSTAHVLLPPGAKTKPERLTAVPVYTLPTWLMRHGLAPDQIQVIKMDIQGWEHRVWSRAETLLADARLIWMIEISPRNIVRAGSSMEELVAVAQRWFTHVRDVRRYREAVPVRELPAYLAGALGDGRSYLDALFYTQRSKPVG
jgi:FkbM family methyltransferase